MCGGASWSHVGLSGVGTGTRLVLLSKGLLWARRQALDLSLRGLIILAATGSLLGATLLPGLGFAFGYLLMGGLNDPGVAVGLVILAQSLWSLGRWVGAVPPNRRMEVRNPPDRQVFEALGAHPRAIWTALAVVPACVAAVAGVLAGMGTLVGVGMLAVPGTIKVSHWLCVLFLPVVAAVMEVRLLQLPVRTRRLRVAVPLAVIAIGWLIATAGLVLGGDLVQLISDDKAMALIETVGLAVESVTVLLLCAAAALGGLLYAVPTPTAEPTEGEPTETNGAGWSVERPRGRVVRLSLARLQTTAVLTHRRLGKAAQLIGCGAIGMSVAVVGAGTAPSPRVALGAIALVSAMAMAIAISLNSGVGLRCLERQLRWLHDSGHSAARVVLGHVAEINLEMLRVMAPTIVAVAIFTRSAGTALAALVVTMGAVAASSLGDLLDTTRTAHADGSGESGLVGGLVTAVIQSLLTAPWALLDSGPVFAFATGIGLLFVSSILTTLIAVRRIHP